jgi:serine/threonine protein kinase/tetratricopeptide (TPR) repeat protein
VTEAEEALILESPAARTAQSADRRESSLLEATVPLPRPVAFRALADGPSPAGLDTPPPFLSHSAYHSAENRTFREREVLANRFELIRFIGSGGMGEVYEAKDLELQEPVALKRIRPEVARNYQAIERFKREIQLARKVTHPNVCRTNDLFRHTPDVDGLGVTFLTMELLSGVTLAERIKRDGPLKTVDALPVVLQMAKALQAAHDAGIVHADFKSRNVMLVDSRNEKRARAVVTDFGLARALAEDGAAGNVSYGNTGEFFGSPAYMAPEQVETGEITSKVDIYALGVVMFEMLTGELPFAAETPLASAVRRLRESAPSPRRLVPNLDRRWETVILKCLARSPAERFESAAAVAAALTGVRTTSAQDWLLNRKSAFRAVTAGWKNWKSASAGAILLVAITGAGIKYRQRLSSWPRQEAAHSTDLPAATQPLPAGRSVAVLGFRNISGRRDAAWLSTALSEMMTTELAAGKKLRTIPGEDVSRMKRELALGDPDSLPPAMLTKVGTNLGTEIVVVGSYSDLPDDAVGRIRINVRLESTRDGSVISQATEIGTVSHLYDLVSSTAARLRQTLDAGEIQEADAGQIRASLPNNPAAARLYSEGLGKLELFDALAARALLERAAAIEPSHALTHSRLAEAWSKLGYDAKAQAEAKRAAELSEHLALDQKLRTRGQYYETKFEWAKAAEIYHDLYGSFPANLEDGLKLAEAETKAGHGRTALATLSRLRSQTAAGREDPRIDLCEARARMQLSEFNEMEKAAAAAVQKAEAQGATLVSAPARLARGWALHKLGRDEDGLAQFETAKQQFAAADQSGVADAEQDIAVLLEHEGDFDGAKHTYGAALKIYRAIGNAGGMASVLNDIAIVLWREGNLSAARDSWQQSLQYFREAGDGQGEAKVETGLAEILRKQGDLSGSRSKVEAALAAFRASGDKGSQAQALDTLAQILREQGNLAEAKKHNQEALTLLRAIGDRIGTAEAQHDLALILADQGDLAAARREFQSALAVRDLLHETSGTAETQLELAKLDMIDARSAGTQPIRQLVDLLQEKGSLEERALAGSIMAESLLSEGHAEEAKVAAQQAKSLLVGKEVDAATSGVVAITAATTAAAAASQNRSTTRRSGASTEIGSAQDALRTVAADAERLGLMGINFQARLALGQVQMRYGDPQAGRRDLLFLEKQAASQGFGLIARQAQTARKIGAPSGSVN